MPAEEFLSRQLHLHVLTVAMAERKMASGPLRSVSGPQQILLDPHGEFDSGGRPPSPLRRVPKIVGPCDPSIEAPKSGQMGGKMG